MKEERRGEERRGEERRGEEREKGERRGKESKIGQPPIILYLPVNNPSLLCSVLPCLIIIINGL